jgi:hypothetical protein
MWGAAVSLVVLKPDEIVGKYFASLYGRIGRVVHRFDLERYYVEPIDDVDEPGLMPLATLIKCRFFDTAEAAASARSCEYFAAAQMGSDQP